MSGYLCNDIVEYKTNLPEVFFSEMRLIVTFSFSCIHDICKLECLVINYKEL